MLRYILKRILIFIPTLIIISVVIFALSKIAPGDPVEQKMQGGASAGDTGQLADRQAGEEQYFEVARELGMDLPNFYFQFTGRPQCDTLYKVGRRYEKETLQELSSIYGNWSNVSQYYKGLKSLEIASFNIEKNEDNFEKLRTLRESLNELYREPDEKVITSKLQQIEESINSEQEVTLDSANFIINPETSDTITTSKKQLLVGLTDNFNKANNAFNTMKAEQSGFAKYIPKFVWHGTDSQYHRWIFGNRPWFGKSDDPNKTHGGFLRGEYGVSYSDGRPVWSQLKEALKITFWLNFVAILIIYLVSIPLGVYIAVKKDSLFDRLTTLILFILYSLPGFWIATILIVFFTNSEYGMDWFPGFGLGSNKITSAMGFTEEMGIRLYHIILPLFCLTYGGLAYLSRQMRGGVINTFKQDYIRTARSKGLDENVIIWKHTFRNSLIPVITIFASLFPAMIGGSVIIEIIFSIPGMGKLALDSLFSRDWPILFTVVMFSSILTLIGILVSDILYTIVDPRITFTRKS